MQTRRTLLLSALALGLTSAAAWAAPAAVPSIWEGEKMYTTLAKDGTGIASSSDTTLPVAYVIFDTQC